MAKSADYLDPNRDLEQERKYYLYLASRKQKMTLREYLMAIIRFRRDRTNV
jgi:hypothetical protein